jgi:hypothetical protein
MNLFSSQAFEKSSDFAAVGDPDFFTDTAILIALALQVVPEMDLRVDSSEDKELTCCTCTWEISVFVTSLTRRVGCPFSFVYIFQVPNLLNYELQRSYQQMVDNQKSLLTAY